MTSTTSVTTVWDFDVPFLEAGFDAVGAGVEGAGAEAVVELGVPTRVGVLAVLVVESFLSPRLAVIAQVMPATKIRKAIIKAIRTVFDIKNNIPLNY